MEIWKDVKGYEGYYQVSNYGRVRSLDRITTNGKRLTGKVLSPRKHNRGYVMACLWYDGKDKYTTVHRLVAQAFIPNPHNLEEVNHIDEDKKNNHVSNLEWCTPQHNLYYGTRIERAGIGHRKPVEAFKDGRLVARYESITAATEAHKCAKTTISGCIRGKSKTAKGLVWRLA